MLGTCIILTQEFVIAISNASMRDISATSSGKTRRARIAFMHKTAARPSLRVSFKYGMEFSEIAEYPRSITSYLAEYQIFIESTALAYHWHTLFQIIAVAA